MDSPERVALALGGCDNGRRARLACVCSRYPTRISSESTVGTAAPLAIGPHATITRLIATV